MDSTGVGNAAKVDNIRKIAAAMLDDGLDDPAEDNPNLQAGYTYFGQFVDHDVTFDPTSSLMRQNDSDRLENFRTPRFHLDNLSGGGPNDEPFLYARSSGHFLIGKGRQAGAGTPVLDLCAPADGGGRSAAQ